MLDKILQDLEETGYSHLPSLVTAEDLKHINAFFEMHKDEFGAAKVGAPDNKQRVEAIRGDYSFWLDPLNPLEPFLNIFKMLDQIKEKVNSRFYLGLQQYEAHLAYYPPGSFYKKHLDRFEEGSSRRLTFILYLNQEWKEADGGELVMYDKSENIINTIYPMPGSLVTFMSDEFPHEVKSSTKERRSLTGWMHTKILY